MILAYSGCRLPEALALTVDRVDLAAGLLVFETLKKRRPGVYRSVPAPLHSPGGARSRAWRPRAAGAARQGAWRAALALVAHDRLAAVHAVMQEAHLDGPQASPKGLRHGFGVAAVSAGIPLNLVQKWLGHALDDCRLCRRSRSRGERHRPADVDIVRQ